jgi:hypothetical protein
MRSACRSQRAIETPPFRTLHQRYPIEDLAETLAEAIKTAHPAIPFD